VKKGLKEKVAQGGYPGSAPFGYINNKDDKTIESDPETAPVVRQFFEWYETGDYSVKTLRAKAKREGLLDNLHKYRTSANTIHKVLTNPVYYGKVKFKGEIFKGAYFPLIKESTFNKVQHILSGHAQTQAKTKRQFTYMGLLYCADCGCAITAEMKKDKYVYYHCTNGKGSCSKNYVREEMIDEQVKAVLQGMKLDETRLA
jgi:site-specific DNA recombinase